MENIIAGAFGLLIGTVGVWVGVRQLKNHRILNRWPTTKGRVVERGTYQPNIPYGNADAFRYAPLVKYVYQVGGTDLKRRQVDCRRAHFRRPARNAVALDMRLSARRETFSKEDRRL